MNRNDHERWLLELTAIPTAAGCEDRVIHWVEKWVAQRSSLRLKRDKVGNLLITQVPQQTARGVKKNSPLFITAHLDHPAFVVRRKIDNRTLELEFRGGVQDAYFQGAAIEVFDDADEPHRAMIESLDAKAKPYKRVVARADGDVKSIKRGDIARWVFENHSELPLIRDGMLHTYAADDLAAVAAALATLDVARSRKRLEHVGVLLTVAEEVGFVGAIGVCKRGSVPKSSRLICLENSRSFAESPIGGGPILRVGDRISVFEPRLTNRLGFILAEHQKKNPQFKWQRKLMPGGACEATAFSAYGYQSTCICLPLGNYHNMADIDGVLAGKSPAKVAPEMISVEDFHGMIEMLVVCAGELDSAKIPDTRDRMERIFKKNARVLSHSTAQSRP